MYAFSVSYTPGVAFVVTLTIVYDGSVDCSTLNFFAFSSISPLSPSSIHTYISPTVVGVIPISRVTVEWAGMVMYGCAIASSGHVAVLDVYALISPINSSSPLLVILSSNVPSTPLYCVSFDVISAVSWVFTSDRVVAVDFTTYGCI